MRGVVAAGFGVVLVVSLFTGLAAADTRVGGTVVVDADERVGDVSATGGTVIIEGTVDGDLRAYGGDVIIRDGGEVTGIVRAYGGDVRIDGAVQGNVLAYGGSVTLGEPGTVERSFGAVGSHVTIAGTVGGDANSIASTTTVGETAAVEGNLNHVGDLEDRGGTVGGVVQSADDLALGPPTEVIAAAFFAFMFVADLLLGAVLLWVSPRFADSATQTVRTEPLRTVGVGLVTVVGVVLAIVGLAVTVFGLPLAVALFMLAVVLAWVARVYGQYTLGAISLSFTTVENRYLALFAGVVGVTLLGLIPYLGALIELLVFLLGAGVVALGVRAAQRLIAENRGGLTDI